MILFLGLDSFIRKRGLVGIDKAEGGGGRCESAISELIKRSNKRNFGVGRLSKRDGEESDFFRTKNGANLVGC